MADFLQQPAFEIGSRIDIRGPYSWFVVLRPAAPAETAIENFVAELSPALSQPIRSVRCTDLTFERLRAKLKQPGDDPVLVSDLDQVSADYWGALDVNRTGLARVGAIVLWLSSEGLARLCEHAPNLKSFIGGSIFSLGSSGESMTAEERQRRIGELESHFQMTSAEVIRRAELGTLPSEPHFVEWLVLLDHGDLV